MSWELLDGMLDQSAIWTPHTLQLVLDKVMLRPEQYTYEGVGRDGRPTRLVDFARMRAAVDRGATILLADCNTLTPGIKAICEALGREPGGKVQANLYCSWAAHQAFDVHYDVADVFVTQIRGEKVWRIYQQVVKDPVHHAQFLDTSVHRENKGALSAEIVMRPGDVLYIPGGFCHEAMTEHGASMHVTYEVRAMTAMDVIPLLFDRAVQDEVFRAPLAHPSARDGKALEEQLMRIAGRMREILREPSVRALIEAHMRDFPYPTQGIKLPDDSGKS
jgi:ribosomal protein L16 Arg81 hydroxylase